VFATPDASLDRNGDELTMRVVVAVAFMLVLGVPFAAGVGAMALPVSRDARIAIAVVPVALLVVALGAGVFWLGDIGGAIVVVIGTWAWLLGVGMSGGVRSLIRLVARLQRA
jgi:hypothetical protein